MTTDNAVTLTKEGIAAQKAGDTLLATRLLVQAVQSDPAYEMAWLWLSSCLSIPGEKRYCLDQALRANEQSAPALKGIAALGTVQWVMPAALAPIVVVPPPAMTPDQERRYIERSIAEFTKDGWLVVSQTDRSAQLRKPKEWSSGGTVVLVLLVIGGFLIWYPLWGFAIMLLLIMGATYISKKEELFYLSMEYVYEQSRQKDSPFVEKLKNGGTVCSSCRLFVRKDAIACKHCKVQFVKKLASAPH